MGGTSTRNRNPRRRTQPLSWRQLSLLGVASTIGTGYFLGSGIAIRMAGPSVLLSFLWAALGAYLVFVALSRMTAAEPLEGSFRAYSKKAFGPWAGFLSGWVYGMSELLISGSQMTALSLFARFWFPGVPLWMFASGFAALGMFTVWLGTRGFERVEHTLAVLKLAAILLFIALAAAALLRWFPGGPSPRSLGRSYFPPFPEGFPGWWSSLLFAFYAFGGIEVMGLMALRLKNPEEAPKSGNVMLLSLALLYAASLLLALRMVPWQILNARKSPFIIALEPLDLPFIPHLFNGVLIAAGFSTMTASLFAVTNMLAVLAKDRDAPPIFARQYKGRPYPALAFTTLAVGGSIALSLLLPGRVYESFTAAAGLMLLYNWMFILASSLKLVRWRGFRRGMPYAGMALIAGAIAGTSVHAASRPGLWISMGYLVFLAAFAAIVIRLRKRRAGSRSGDEKPDGVNPEIPSEAEQRNAGYDRYRRKQPFGEQLPEYAGERRHGDIPNNDTEDNAPAVLEEIPEIGLQGRFGDDGSVDAQPEQNGQRA